MLAVASTPSRTFWKIPVNVDWYDAYALSRPAAADARTVKRIAEQKRLVEGQTALAARLANGAGGGRQIGYITGELD